MCVFVCVCVYACVRARGHMIVCMCVCEGGGGEHVCLFEAWEGSNDSIPEWMLRMPLIQLSTRIANCRVVNLCDGLTVSLSITYTLK